MYEGAGILFVADHQGTPHLLLGRRSHRPHQGQWSIPGGRRSRQDASLFETAIRETEEEASSASENATPAGLPAGETSST